MTSSDLIKPIYPIEPIDPRPKCQAGLLFGPIFKTLLLSYIFFKKKEIGSLISPRARVASSAFCLIYSLEK